MVNNSPYEVIYTVSSTKVKRHGMSKKIIDAIFFFSMNILWNTAYISVFKGRHLWEPNKKYLFHHIIRNYIYKQNHYLKVHWRIIIIYYGCQKIKLDLKGFFEGNMCLLLSLLHVFIITSSMFHRLLLLIMILLQSVTKYLRFTLVFMKNRAGREKFNYYFLGKGHFPNIS